MTGKFFKPALGVAFAGALAMTAITAAPQPAQAGRGDAFWLGLGLGVIGTAIVAGAAHAEARKRRHYRRIRYRPRPWTPAWYRYCAAKYRSFNPETGYYLSYSGRYKFCR